MNMKKKRKDGYIAGVISLLIFAISAYFTVMNASNLTMVTILGVLSAFFGVLGLGSLWKPETFGAAVLKYFERLSESEERSDSHDKQVQNKSAGIQVMAGDQSKININVNSGKIEEAKIKTVPVSKAVEPENVTTEEKATQRRVLLQENGEITDLNVDNILLDEIYEQARKQAVEIYSDALLSKFTIQVFPYCEAGAKVIIYMDFFSKFADKTSSFRYADIFPSVEHTPPNRRAKSDYDREVFATLPWKASPHWSEFLKRAYKVKGPFVRCTKTMYHLIAYAYDKPNWSLIFNDEFTGDKHDVNWDGKGLDRDGIKFED